MAMSKGNKACSSGLAKEIWDNLSANGYPGKKFSTESDEDYTLRVTALKSMCFAISKSVIDHLTNNAEITNVSGNGAGNCAGTFVHAPFPGPTAITVTQSGTGNII